MRRILAVAVAAAIAAAACAPKKPKTNAEILLTVRMAQVLLRENRPTEAEKAFRDVLKDDSKNPEMAAHSFTEPEWLAFVAGIKADEFVF